MENQEDEKADGQNSDSGGGGTLYSFHRALDRNNLANDPYFVFSCALHDLQSCFALAVKAFLGDGGLGKRNGLQLLHDLSDLQTRVNDDIEMCLRDLLKISWKEVYPDIPGDVPRDLLAIMQEPIITRWWTTGIAALSFRKYGQVYSALAKAVVNQSTTKMAENMIGSDIVSLAREPVIRSDVEVMATYAEVFFNENFKWSQGSDPNVGTPGFLTHHQVSRFFIKARKMEEMIRSWKTIPEFEHFRKSVEAIPTEATKEMPINRDVQEKKMDMFLKTAYEQLNKHSAKLVTTNCMLYSSSSEEQIT
jgi:hypothetical protein